MFKKKTFLIIIGFALGFLYFATDFSPKVKAVQYASLVNKETLSKATADKVHEEFAYDMRIDTFHVENKTIQPNEFVSDILAKYKVDDLQALEIAKEAKQVYDFKKFRAGNEYTIISEKNKPDTVARYLVYNVNPIEYVVYNLQNPTDIQRKERPTQRVRRSVSGVIHGSLWNSLIDGNIGPELAVKLAQVYQWTIDFTRIHEGDSFEAVFDEIYVDGKYYRTDSVYASYVKHNNKDYYAFYFDQGEDHLKSGYYDENGESLKRAFLRAPVKYSRISSRYSGRRFHPVQKRYKAHLGTDYAAPHGTPIHATANGVVIASSYTRGNGKYVKIKHSNTYTTQYLHMSRRAVRKGQKVNQGDVIGYVGSTGLATGPHVCYRFWKNGKQVDHLRLDLPSGDPIEKENMAAFEETKSELLRELNLSPSLTSKDPIVEKASVSVN